MKFDNAKEFLAQDQYSVTLIGMSGVGKTWLADKLSDDRWFHFSGDYRIGTRYMEEPILDNIKAHAMRDPFLADLLRSDSIYLASNITTNNLAPLSTFLGKLGDPKKGGLDLEEFRRRQALHRVAEIAALCDVGSFREKAEKIYGYPHFINDAGGSAAEVIDFDANSDPVLEELTSQTLLLYIEATEENENTLCQRAIAHPKPMYLCDAFLLPNLEIYLKENGLAGVNDMDPDDFSRWMFPKLIKRRRALYETLGSVYGYTVSSVEAGDVQDEQDFLTLIGTAIERQTANLGGGAA